MSLKISKNWQSLTYIIKLGGLYNFHFSRVIYLDLSNPRCLGATCIWPEKKAMVISEYVNSIETSRVRKQASWLAFGKQLCRHRLRTTVEQPPRPLFGSARNLLCKLRSRGMVWFRATAVLPWCLTTPPWGEKNKCQNDLKTEYQTTLLQACFPHFLAFIVLALVPREGLLCVCFLPKFTRKISDWNS